MILAFELSRNVDKLEFNPIMHVIIMENQVFEDTWLVVHSANIVAKLTCIPGRVGG